MEGKILNWKFEEQIDPSRYWVESKIKMLMMYVIYETTTGSYTCPVWREQENEEMCELIDLELKLNLKHQHGILS